MKASIQSRSLRGADLLSIDALTGGDITRILRTARLLKRTPSAGASLLAGRSIVLIFEKPSLRTRMSFEVGIHRLGGHAVYFDQSKDRLGERESIRDTALNLERWVHAVVARVHSHAALEDLAANASIPIVNALSDRFHPCQALADLMTLQERFGDLRGRSLTYLGDGNNVCHSLVQGAARAGMRVRVVTPPGCEPAPDVIEDAEREADAIGGSLLVSNDPADARASDAIYTDAWVSMGQSARAEPGAFERLRVDAAMMRRASEGRASGAPPVLFMHCLPATRGNEVTDEVIDSPASVVYDQAENRMHAQNGLLVHLLAQVDPSTIAA